MGLCWSEVLKFVYRVFFGERREGEEEKKMGREGEMMTPWERESICKRIEREREREKERESVCILRWAVGRWNNNKK